MALSTLKRIERINDFDLYYPKRARIYVKNYDEYLQYLEQNFNDYLEISIECTADNTKTVFATLNAISHQPNQLISTEKWEQYLSSSTGDHPFIDCYAQEKMKELAWPTKTWLLRAAPGIGKTKAIMEYMKECINNGKRKILIIVPTKAIARTMHAQMKDLHEKSFCYLDEKDSLKWPTDAPVVICINSLRKLVNYEPDVVVVDELESIMRVFYSSLFQNDGSIAAQYVFKRFNDTLKYAPMVIGADADLSPNIGSLYLSTIRSNNVFDFKVDVNTQSIDYEFEAIEMSYSKDLLDMIIKDLQENKRRRDNSQPTLKLVFLSDLKTDGIDMFVKLINEYDSDAKCLAITSDTNKSKEVMDFLSNPNILVKDYDVLCYSPALSTSVSIEVPHFNRMYGYFSGMAVCVDEAVQMLRRVRTFIHESEEKTPFYYFYSPYSANCKKLSEKECYDQLQASESLSCQFLGSKRGHKRSE